MKKVFISMDTEGLSGLTSWKEMDADPTCAGKAYIRELKWVIDELFKISPEIEEITLCDSHSRGENLPYGVFNDPRITQIKGYPRQDYMMSTLDSSYDMMFLIGYHGMIGSKYALMDHSYSSAGIYNIRVNGVSVGEVELNCFYAATLNVPVGLISGDNILEEELKGNTNINSVFVKTKEGLGRFAGKLYSPDYLEPVFREATKTAVDRLNNNKLKAIESKTPTVLEIDTVTTVMADAAEMIPGMERVSGRTVKYTSSSFKEIMHMILVVALLTGRFSNYI